MNHGSHLTLPEAEGGRSVLVDHAVDHLQLQKVVARAEGPEGRRTALERPLAHVPIRTIQPPVGLDGS